MMAVQHPIEVKAPPAVAQEASLQILVAPHPSGAGIIMSGASGVLGFQVVIPSEFISQVIGEMERARKELPLVVIPGSPKLQ